MARTDVPSPITIQYNLKGKGVLYTIEDFFKKTPIYGCTVNCNFGDTCGSSLTETNTSLMSLNETQELKASNDRISGYS